MPDVVLITGGSSGIGSACAAAFAQKGDVVYEISRREVPQEGVTHLYADVKNEQSVVDAVDVILNKQGRIDVLVCCAGFGISGALEFTPSERAHSLLDVNLFGTDVCVRAVLGTMRAQKKGRIVFVSSVASVVPIPFQGWYSAGKAALNAYARALAGEVRPYGVTICTLLPGDVHTGFTGARQKLHAGDDAYAGRIARSVSVMERDEQNGMPSQKIAEACVRAAKKKHVRPQQSIGVKYRLFCVLAKFLPVRLCDWIVGRIYAQ